MKKRRKKGERKEKIKSRSSRVWEGVTDGGAVEADHQTRPLRHSNFTNGEVSRVEQKIMNSHSVSIFGREREDTSFSPSFCRKPLRQKSILFSRIVSLLYCKETVEGFLREHNH